MLIKECHFKNFGSYQELDIDLSGNGLSLLYGKTGSGKSTVMDMVCWGLFGVTAKDIKSDDVRSWGADKDTISIINVSSKNENLMIVRVRGAKSSSNDLYFTASERPGISIRGKDITETQKLVNDKLGCDAETFIAGSYYHEFSPTGAFFTAKAKDRRELFEKLASLELPNKLSLKCSELKKKAKTEAAARQQELDRLEGRYDQVSESWHAAIKSQESWETTRAKKVIELEKKSQSFEQIKSDKILELDMLRTEFESSRTKKMVVLMDAFKELSKDYYPPEHLDAKLEDLVAKEGKKCSACGETSKKHLVEINNKRESLLLEKVKLERLTEEIIRNGKLQDENKSQINPYLAQIQSEETKDNYFEFQLREERSRVNPWLEEQERLLSSIVDLEKQLEGCKKLLAVQERRLSAFGVLLDLAAVLRGELLKSAIKLVQDNTNQLLETYFDAEIRVTFSANDSDSLNVEIAKSGHDCSYAQLSKGQRGLLKLCFSLSVMNSVADSCGIKFENLMLDEALDGLDDDLKIKAFSLFQALENEHSSTIIIDHNESFQNMFAKRFHVTMMGDNSILKEQSA